MKEHGLKKLTHTSRNTDDRAQCLTIGTKLRTKCMLASGNRGPAVERQWTKWLRRLELFLAASLELFCSLDYTKRRGLGGRVRQLSSGAAVTAELVSSSASISSVCFIFCLVLVGRFSSPIFSDFVSSHFLTPNCILRS